MRVPILLTRIYSFAPHILQDALYHRGLKDMRLMYQLT